MKANTIVFSDDFYKRVASRANTLMNETPYDLAEQLKESYSFSPNYNKWKRDIINKSHSSTHLPVAVKRILLVAAVIAALIAFASSVGAIKEYLYSFYMEYFSGYVVGYFGYGDENSVIQEDSNSVTAYYVPSYIPEGYEYISHTKYGMSSELLYSDGHKQISFRQYTIDTVSTFDTERYEVNTIRFNGTDATYFVCDSKIYFTWSANDYYFQINAELPIEEIIKIAESILPEK